MSRRNLYWLLGISSIALLGLTVAYSAPARDKDRRYRRIDKLVSVFDKVENQYVRELDDEQLDKLLDDMITGGLERLDPHSTYLSAKEAKHFRKQNEGKFGGIGIQIGYDRQNRGQLVVISPMPGTPAYRAGVMAGDAIVKLDGKSIENLRLNDVVELIQGDPGQKLVLTVYHEGGKEAVDIPLERELIKVQNVMGDLREAKNAEKWDFMIDHDNKIGYIRLHSFNETAAQELTQAIKELKDAGMRGLILDLRNNPGGLLRGAVDISNLFLKEGDRIVSTKGRNGHDEIYDARSEDALLKSIFPDVKDADERARNVELRSKMKGVTLQPAEQFPVIVLVNKHSASASEIVAAALQDHGRALIIGERSYGKGSVQNIMPMSKDKDPDVLKLTTASYWRPSGKNIHRFPDSKEADDWGVKPSPGMEVPMKDDERYEYMLYRSERDVVRNGQPKPAKKDDTKKEFKDRVLEKALEQLRKEIKEGKAAFMPPERGAA